VATVNLSTLAVGSQSIIASYGGDTNFNASVSAGTMITVSAAPTGDFGLSISPSSMTLTSGGQTTFTATVTPTNGFNGAVSFQCTNFPANVTCSFSPATVTSSGTTTLTLRTGVSTVASLHEGREAALAGIALSGLLGMCFRRRRPLVRMLCLTALLAGPLLVLNGCGHKATIATSSQTPSGTYAMGVLGTSGTTSHNASFTLVVQ